MKPLTIGQLAKRAGISVETVRFYERKGLIADPPRSRSGYRQYASENLDRVRFIRRAKEVGFTLKEIQELLDLRTETESQCRSGEAAATRAMERIDCQVKELLSMRTALASLLDACRSKTAMGECPIIEVLEEAGENDGDS